MYTRYFGLTEKPFAIAPNPRYLYLSDLHREAMAHMLYGINSEGCIILLTGDVGTGKTTVCRCLLDQLSETTDIALILNPRLTIMDLFKTICEELKIPMQETSPTIKTYVDLLNVYLLEGHAKGRNTVLIIDEAQNLDIEILEQLRLLTNLETNTSKLLQIVLIGQPELRQILTDPKLTQINQRITTRYHLRPLQAGDIQTYIEHRIAIAGGNTRHALFSESAIEFVARFSKGIPRIINLLCDHALLGAYADNQDHVSLKVMKKAAGELATITSAAPSAARKKLVIALILASLALGIPAGLYFVDRRDNLALLKHNLALLQQTIQPGTRPKSGEDKASTTTAPNPSTPSKDNQNPK